eukprot:GHVL01044992.1.p1 GENE.GHVL01044992.1~~GHVL01044992.1.p1  ORF type:complete len:135 (-),score=22.36 GHVL01044992.1:12-362(-)
MLIKVGGYEIGGLFAAESNFIIETARTSIKGEIKDSSVSLTASSAYDEMVVNATIGEYLIIKSLIKSTLPAVCGWHLSLKPGLAPLYCAGTDETLSVGNDTNEQFSTAPPDDDFFV